MSAETAVLIVDLLLCIAVAMTLGSIKRVQPATGTVWDSKESPERSRRQL
jgi:hypothetical protein